MPRKPKYTTSEWIGVAKAIHGAHLDYTDTIYVGSHVKVSVRCQMHGTFQVTPHNHISRRSGCPSCAVESRAKTHIGRKRPGVGGAPRMTDQEFRQKAAAVHGQTYDYGIYQSMRTKMEIRCARHGVFQQLPSAHLSGRGCPTCFNENSRDTQDEFITKARLVHGQRYSYESVRYVNSVIPVAITCQTHGDFLQQPNGHLQGRGCARCASHISRAEIELFEFVKSIAPQSYQSDRKLIGPYELDIVIPEHKLAIEYCGLFFHSSAMKIDRNYHLRKHELCEQIGFRLITIFEDEWVEKTEMVKATLRHFIGVSDRGIGARQAVLKEIDWKTAKPFLEQQHLLGGGSPTAKNVGAFDPAGTLIAVMTFGKPSDERGRFDAVEMKRFATDKRNHPGLGSRMFAWALSRYGFDRVVAFVDRRWFTGSFKTISGFRVDGVTPPTFFWVNTDGRRKRRFITKADLLEIDDFYGSSLTKPEMMAQLGYHRIWDCGKVRLLWER